MKKTLATTTMSVRLRTSDKRRLEALAAATDRPVTALAAKAISEFLDLNEWQMRGIEQAIHSLDAGDHIAHETVKKWARTQRGTR